MDAACVDGSGYDTPSEHKGGELLSSGRNGSAWQFDGVDDYFEIEITTYPNMRLTAAWTLSAWIYPTKNHTGNSAIVGRWNGVLGTRSYWLGLNAAEHILALVSQDGSVSAGKYNSAEGVTALASSEWHHVAAVFTPTVSLGVFLDGTLDGITTASVVTGTCDTFVPAYTSVPSVGSFLPVSSTVAFGGKISDVMIFDAALGSRDLRRVMMGLMPVEV